TSGMNRWLPILAIVAALATAAFVRPPRAAPAFSLTTTAPLPTTSGCCHPERSGRRALAKSRGRRHHRRSSRSRNRRKGNHHSPAPHNVDLNHADAATLARVPGINEGLARRIIAYRDLVGPFEDLSDLDDLDGVSPSRLDTLARYVVVR
ncbi:MAG: helix-hairpin-helix domain-containing protein, partial [Polyangiaceae bacterium]